MTAPLAWNPSCSTTRRFRERRGAARGDRSSRRSAGLVFGRCGSDQRTRRVTASRLCAQPSRCRSSIPAHRTAVSGRSRTRGSTSAAIRPIAAHFATMLLVDLVYSHGDDWFVFPVAGRSGSIVTIRSLEVVDLFGRHYSSEARLADDSPRYPGLHPPADFSLFACKGLRPELLVLWPVAEAPLESAPLERVQFGTDEQSNLLWALERIVDCSRSPARRRRSRCRASSLSGACTRWRYDPREELRLRPRLGSRVRLAPLQARLGRGGRAGLLPMGPRRLFPAASTTDAASRGRGAEGGGPGRPRAPPHRGRRDGRRRHGTRASVAARARRPWTAGAVGAASAPRPSHASGTESSVSTLWSRSRRSREDRC